MSVAVGLEALGWLAVVWYVVVHAVVQRGRLPRDGMAYRIAGGAAAASVVMTGVVEEIWPVAVLGLLWLRTEVFGHRHHVPDRRSAAPAAPGPPAAKMPDLLVGALARGANQAPPQPRPPQPHSQPHLPHPHLPHPHLARRTVDRVFRIEMGIVITIVVVLFGIWAQQQREEMGNHSNRVVCNWIDGC